MALLLVTGEHTLYFLLELLAEGLGLKHFETVAMRKELANEVCGGTDIETEVRIVGSGGYLALRLVEWQGAQVVGRLAVGTDDDMRHRRFVCQHTKILRKVLLGREILWHLKTLFRQCDRQHAVEAVGGIVMTRKGQQIPALVEEFESVWGNGLFTALCPKTAIGNQDALVLFDGADDGLQELLTCRHILENDTIFQRDTVGEHATHGERGEHPALQTVVVEHLRIIDVIPIISIALDNNAKHIEDGVTMAVERGTREGIAIRHLVLFPSPTQLIEAQASMTPQRIDEPDILLKDQGRLHVRVLLL